MMKCADIRDRRCHRGSWDRRTEQKQPLPAPYGSTTCYVTFEVKGGERLEFAVPGTEYGQIVEGDRGELAFQGTRYLSFERKT